MSIAATDSAKKLEIPEWAKANEEYFMKAAEMINSDAGIRWFASFCNFILAVDHMVDHDPIGKYEPEAVLERFFDWDTDPLWARAKERLLPVCASCYAAWQVGTKLNDRKMQMDVYFHIPCAVGFILHGRKHVEEHAEDLHKIASKFSEVDDNHA